MLGGFVVTLAVGREFYPRWERHLGLRLAIDGLIFILLLLLILLLAVKMSTAP